MCDTDRDEGEPEGSRTAFSDRGGAVAERPTLPPTSTHDTTLNDGDR